LPDGENATVLGPSHGLVVKALRLAAIAAGVGTRTQQHKSTKFADQNDGARAFSSVCDFSPTETLTGISAELCPNGNRLWCPESRFADTVTCRSRKSHPVRIRAMRQNQLIILRDARISSD
jgi:hypothetical protein